MKDQVGDQNLLLLHSERREKRPRRSSLGGPDLRFATQWSRRDQSTSKVVIPQGVLAVVMVGLSYQFRLGPRRLAMRLGHQWKRVVE